MHSPRMYSLLLGIFMITLLPTQSQIIHTGEEQLDGDNYILRWEINADDEIHFEVIVQTVGYVGLGISPTGGMAGADIFIAGVYDNGTTYSSDRHATGNGLPVVDQHSDWILDSAYQNDTHTVLTFHRLLNTCDEEEDNPITDETTHVIWAVGRTDSIEFHEKRGTQSINFFMQDDTEFDPNKFDKFEILTNSKMPTQHTSYLCTFHESPSISDERHIVAFETLLTALARQHTQQVSLFKCVPPEGSSPEEVFGPFVGRQGQHCFESHETNDFPITYCKDNLVYVWGRDGKRMVFPPEIGYPIPGRKEYYAMQVHYDNPNEMDQLEFDIGARIYYTKSNELRAVETGILKIAHSTAPQLTIPPNSQNFVVAAHCGGACTNAYIPNDGVTIVNNLFHSHLNGRKMKLRHFRGNAELPWIDVDNQYDFNYQQNKPLSSTVKILKGDQLTLECTYDNSWAVKAVIGGLAAHEEMCQAFLYVYPKTSLRLCDSSQSLDSHFQFLGITDVTKKNSTLAGGLPEYDIISPERLAGDYLDSVSSKFEWTTAFRNEYQEEKRFGLQEGSCCTEGSSACSGGDVKYPVDLVEYKPINECDGVTFPPTTTTGAPGTTSEVPCECENLRSAYDSLRSELLSLRSEFDSLRIECLRQTHI